MSSSTVLAVDAKGWYDDCCDLTEFHFTQFQGRAAGEELRVRLSMGRRLPLEGMLNEWLGAHWTVNGRRCDHAGNCVEAAKADLQLQKVTNRHIFGRYVADFNGQHLEGQFAVKYRRKVPPCICE